MFGPVDTFVAPVVEYVVLALVLVNMGTRLFAYRSYRKQARSDDHDEQLSRNVVHEASNVVLVLASFYLMTVHHHAGMVMSALVLGLFIADFFEFEAREVELRKGERLSRPNGALTASALVFLYAAYQSLFFLIEPYWSAIV
jgi:trehalose/maltose hydrolase-like predicted phosphorylase